jgi:CubicO group peptidase (beta-lactamase class C family)
MVRSAIYTVLVSAFVVSANADVVNGSTGWASHYDITRDRFSSLHAKYTEAGLIQIDVEAYPCGGEIRYAMVWQENSENRGWISRVDMTEQQFNDLRDEYEGGHGYRLSDIEVYIDDFLKPVFAAIWKENVEGLSWDARYGLTRPEFEEYYAQQIAAGRRLIDFEAYGTNGGVRYAAVWYDNDGAVQWLHDYELTRSEYDQRAAERDAEYRITDFESYKTAEGHRYAAIWELRADNLKHRIASDLDENEFQAVWLRYRDQGYRHVQFEWADTDLGPRYSGLWVEHQSERLVFGDGEENALYTLIDTTIRRHRIDNEIPGISAAIVYNGEMIYLEGQGQAGTYGDPPIFMPAHGETVYMSASISKVIGSTLAAMLEESGELTDGSPVELDLSRPTSEYLPAMPAHHTHTVEQLLAHLGCVGHYDTDPPIPNQTIHYSSAMEAVQSIWDTPLVTGCTVGEDRYYSTAAFTFVGAVLEQATGRTIQELVRDEIAGKLGLPSIRAQWADMDFSAGPFQWTVGHMQSDYNRATRYSDSGQALDDIHNNNSWKVLGGGIEMTVRDLAWFGWSVLIGAAVSPSERDNRLWMPLPDDCVPFVSWDMDSPCRNGIGWELRVQSGRRVAYHGGSWAGARTHVGLYPDDYLVIAIMSNRRGHSPSGLTNNLANLILGYFESLEKPAASETDGYPDKDAQRDFVLHQNYPNPFNPSTTITYNLPAAGFVTLKVYSILGEEVAVLVSDQQRAGTHSVRFDAGNLASGVYLYRIKSGSFTENRKMLLIR